MSMPEPLSGTSVPAALLGPVPRLLCSCTRAISVVPLHGLFRVSTVLFTLVTVFFSYTVSSWFLLYLLYLS